MMMMVVMLRCLCDDFFRYGLFKQLQHDMVDGENETILSSSSASASELSPSKTVTKFGNDDNDDDDDPTPDPKIVGVMQSKHYGGSGSRIHTIRDHSKDHILFPQLRLTRLNDEARRPEPTKDSPLYNVVHSAYRSYILYPLRRYDIDVDQCIEVETGWALHSYPADLYTIQVNLNPAYVRHGLACFTTNLDMLVGRMPPFDRIALFVYNWTNSKTVTIHPSDDVFEIRFIPKQSFWLTTDGAVRD